MRNYKSIIGLSAIITLIGVFFSGCVIGDKLRWLDNQSGEVLEIIDGEDFEDISSSTTSIFYDEVIDVNPMNFTKETKQVIDAWLKDNNLNRYGDPVGTNYEKGTPLIEKLTGKNIERFDYILDRIPDLMEKIKE